MSDNNAKALRSEWYDNIVRRSTIRTLASQYSVGQLSDMYLTITGRDTRQSNAMKLARLLKDAYVRKYANNFPSYLIHNVQCYKQLHLVTFQCCEVFDELKRYGKYEPNPRLGTELETEMITAGNLGYFPVWFVNPLVLGQSNVDVDSFCLRSFMGFYETAFPMHRYDISNDYYLFEVVVDTSVINMDNSSYLCTCLPNIEMKNLLGVYSFYRNDPDCGLPNTCYEPYIKVVETYSDNAMCIKDYAAALEHGTYTGTMDDFDL